METDRFRRYEENYLNSTRIISRCMNQLESAQGNVDVVVSQTVEIEGELSEAEGYLRALEVEFKTLSTMEKKVAQQKINEYKTEHKQLSTNFQSAKFKAESQALKGGPAARNKLMNSNSRLDSSTATLEQSRMLLGQTEQLGDTIISDLENQKEVLVSTRDKVKETKRYTVDARSILRGMSNRALMHKICVGLFILLLFAAIIAVGYYGVVKK